MKEGGERKSSNILVKTLERCRSLGGYRRPAWGVPAGCFVVLVGPAKERFAVRAECANHRLFRALLDEAETEYGFAGCDGPLELPCGVEAFRQVMWEMEAELGDGDDPAASPGRCGLSKGYHMMSPARLLVVAGGRC